MEFRSDKAFPAILAFQYGPFIRARGELLIRKEKEQARIPWTEVMKLSDQEFCDQLKLPLEDLRALQTELKPSLELDLPKKKALKYGVRGRVPQKRAKEVNPISSSERTSGTVEEGGEIPIQKTAEEVRENK